MAAFTQNISNTVRAFGGGPASLWNAYSWNAFKWGEGTATIGMVVGKLVVNSQGSTDFFAKQTGKNVVNSVSPTSDMISEVLSDGSGYDYVFTSNASNAEDRDIASWATGTANDATWITASVGSTTWS